MPKAYWVICHLRRFRPPAGRF